ncbi:MAG: DNA translocase FtsK [Cytophagales bacterium]|nr:MAG: DNA translocase FtsK [Cytophagales bacterium]TAF61320.1 MAG: DNA translocase FtsK [Cytophagales bacterium]
MSPITPENTFRTPSNEEKEPETPTAEAAKKIPVATEERFVLWSYRRVLGGFLMLLVLLLGVSFISFLFTGASDQSIVEGLFSVSVSESATEVQNWLGLFGAFCAHILAYKLFGLAAFLWLPILFELGKSMYFETPIQQSVLSKRVAFVFGISVWTSTALSWLVYLLSSESFFSFYCGGIGWGLMLFLTGLLGVVGTPLILIGAAVAYWYFAKPTWLIQAKPENKDTSSENKQNSNSNSSTKNQENISKSDEENNSTSTPETPLQETLIRKVGTYHEYEVGNQKNGDKSEASNTETTETKPQNRYQSNELEPVLEIEPKVLAINTQNSEQELNLESLFQTEESKTDESANNDKPPVGSQAVRKTQAYIMPVEALMGFKLPELSLLKDVSVKVDPVDMRELEDNKANIVRTLQNFKVLLEDIKATVGPTVTLYELWPAQGVKISQIRNLEDDIALNLKALGIRIIAPMPGKGTIGLEVPNKKREMVTLKELLESPKFKDSKKELPIALGKNISNEIIVTDLTKMPHLLIAGATGQGKSVGINVLIASLLYKKHPGELKFVLIDPKKVEFSLYNKLEKHYLAKLSNSAEAVVTDAADAVQTLNALVVEMNDRYDLLKAADCRQVTEYNAKIAQNKLELQKGHRFLPYIVVVIDELADLMITISKDIEKPIARLAQMARAIGIHLVVATQRPSVNVITGVIKANFPARMAFRVSSKVDSRVILDVNGADQLVGQGDMLLSNGSDIMRLQCAFIDTQEVEGLCDSIFKQEGYETAYPLPDLAETSS